MSDNDKLENETPAEETPVEEMGSAEDFSDLRMAEDDQAEDAAFFDEEADFSGDDEFLEEDWEAYDDEFADENVDAPPAKKKKSKSDKLVIGGGAVVGVLVLLFMMGGGGGENPAPQKTVSAPPAATAEQQMSAVKKQAMQKIQTPATNQRDMVYGRSGEENAGDTDKLQGGFLNNPEALDAMEREADKAFEDAGFYDEYYYEDEYPEEVNGANTGEGQIQDDYTPTLSNDFAGDTGFEQPEAQGLGSVPPMPTPIRQTETSLEDDADDGFMSDSDIDFEAEMEMAEEIPRSPADQLRQSQQNETSSVSLPKAQDVMIKKAPATFESSGIDMSQIEALSEKLDRISGRLDSMETTVASLEDNMVHYSDIPDVSGLEKSIKALENKVDSISEKTSISSYQKAAPVSRPKTKEKTASSVVPVPAKKTTVSVVSTEVKEDPWILKSIRPGTAWVSRKGDSDMKTVQVGDSLPGIGKITAIDYIDGQWVVQGTTSKITQ